MEKNNECDFITRDENKKLDLYQVCFELNEDNKDREINGILTAMEYTKQMSGLILTLSQADELGFGKRTIYVKPVWQWLLET